MTRSGYKRLQLNNDSLHHYIVRKHGLASPVDGDERDAIALQFGVDSGQVVRDHLISHLLAVISQTLGDRVHFIGGTALARTYLPNGRLSEDVDLIAVDSRKSVAQELDSVLPRALARTHGRLTLDPPLSYIRDTEASFLRSTGGVSVRVQLLSSSDRTLWPTERQTLVQRYQDAPPAELAVPTLPGFAASKTATWADRAAPRDLWDLWALNEIGAINANALDLFKRYGPTGRAPGDYIFDKPPSDVAWRTQLAGQTRLTVTAAEAITAVRKAWASAKN
ncbi:nucleotidyl transferase AbiEii/AbiGii toxin family protein [Mycobacteroides franklinii]|uniref:nucleotidyl transferase AbiEii/AbiGii toxin family protein n=1 Tax=Mycobacteroides franklinii TaxID=948102 RepID=UPI002E8DCDE2|nr:nucleotidyl transferase AbiEii/AbiGii toxin family protein [Mycobacteroides franklinii]